MSRTSTYLRRRWGRVLPIMALVIALLATAAVASVATKVAAGAITAVRVVQGTGADSIAWSAANPAGYYDLPGAATKLRVPKHRRGLIIARFQGDSHCDVDLVIVGVNQQMYCSVRVMIAGPSTGGGFVEMNPAAGHAQIFQRSTTPAGLANGSHGIERSYGPVIPGKYRIKVQYGMMFADDASDVFNLRNWHFTVERADIS